MGLPVTTNVVVACIVLAVLDILVVTCRFVARRKNGGYGIDDWLIIPSAICAIATSIFLTVVIYTTGLGGNRFAPQGNVGLAGPSNMIRLSWIGLVSTYLNIVCLFFAKVSLLMLYRRLFRGAKFLMCVWVVFAITCAWGVGFLIVTALYQDIRILKLSPQAYGMGLRAVWYSRSISHSIIDFMIFCLPQPVIWGLQMPLKKKASVSFVCLLGILIVIVSILRIFTFEQNNPSAERTFLPASNYLTVFEASGSVICVSLPTLGPLFKRAGKLVSSIRKSLASSHKDQHSTLKNVSAPSTPSDRSTRTPTPTGEKGNRIHVSTSWTVRGGEQV